MSPSLVFFPTSSLPSPLFLVVLGLNSGFYTSPEASLQVCFCSRLFFRQGLLLSVQGGLE
jgi:hypothetical protein